MLAPLVLEKSTIILFFKVKKFFKADENFFSIISELWDLIVLKDGGTQQLLVAHAKI